MFASLAPPFAPPENLLQDETIPRYPPTANRLVGFHKPALQTPESLEFPATPSRRAGAERGPSPCNAQKLQALQNSAASRRIGCLLRAVFPGPRQDNGLR